MSAKPLFELLVRTKAAALRLDDMIEAFNRLVESKNGPPFLHDSRVPSLVRDMYDCCEELITIAREFEGTMRQLLTDIPEFAEEWGCVLEDEGWKGAYQALSDLNSRARRLKEVLFHDLARKSFRNTFDFVREPNIFEAVFSHGYNHFVECTELAAAIDVVMGKGHERMIAIGEDLVQLRNSAAMIDAAMDKVIVFARPCESTVDYMGGEVRLPALTILDGAELDSLTEVVIATTKKFASGVKEIFPQIRQLISTMPGPEEDPQYLSSWDSAAWVLMNLQKDAEKLQAAVLLDRKEGKYTRTINLCRDRRRYDHFESQMSKYAINEVEADAEYRAAVLASVEVEHIESAKVAAAVSGLPKSLTQSAAERETIRAQREADVVAYLRENKTPTVAELLKHTKIPSAQTVYDMVHIPEVVAWREYLSSKRKGRTPVARERQFAPGAETLIAAPLDELDPGAEETLADLVAQQNEEQRRDQRGPRRKQTVDE